MHGEGKIVKENNRYLTVNMNKKYFCMVLHVVGSLVILKYFTGFVISLELSLVN